MFDDKILIFIYLYKKQILNNGVTISAGSIYKGRDTVL